MIIVDDEDTDLLTGFNWYIDSDGYVRSGRNRLHQLIGKRIGLTLVCFRNGEKTDCRRTNLEQKRSRDTDLPLGVYRSGQRYAAIAWGDGWRVSAGSHSTILEAVKARENEIFKRKLGLPLGRPFLETPF